VREWWGKAGEEEKGQWERLCSSKTSLEYALLSLVFGGTPAEQEIAANKLVMIVNLPGKANR